MAYQVALSNTSTGGCGCGSTTTTTSPTQSTTPQGVMPVPVIEQITPGVLSLPGAVYDLHLIQGVSQSIKLCLFEGALSDLSCIKTDGTITLVNPTCYEVGDTITILGESATRGGPCFTKPIFTNILTVDTDRESITIDPNDLPVALNEDACYPEISGSITVPIGCTEPTVTPQTDPPVITKIIQAENIVLSGGILSRSCDYREEIGVNTTANNHWSWTRVCNRIAPGDYIKIEDGGLNKYVKVLESHIVQTSAGLINKFRTEDAPTSTGCYVGVIRRGLVIPIFSRIDADGCFEISIDGASTAGLQLPGTRVQYGSDGSYTTYSPMGVNGNQSNYKMSSITSSSSPSGIGYTNTNQSRMGQMRRFNDPNSISALQSQLQLTDPDLSQDCNPCELCLGNYTITMSWFYNHPTTNKLVSRSQVVARGRAFMQPSHHISFQQ